MGCSVPIVLVLASPVNMTTRNTLEYSPLAVFSSPPETLEYDPLAVLDIPPETLE